MNELAERKEKLKGIHQLSMDELAALFVKADSHSAVIKGTILLAGREQADKEYKNQGFRNPDHCFGDWVSLKLSDTLNQQSLNRLTNLAKFFANRSIENIGLSVGYLLAAPFAEKYASKAYELIGVEFKKTGKRMRFKDSKALLNRCADDIPAIKQNREREQARIAQREKGIEACRTESDNLYNFIQLDLLKTKAISSVDRNTLEAYTTPEYVFDNGVEEARQTILNHFGRMQDITVMDEPVTPKEGIDEDLDINPETNRAYWQSSTKWSEEHADLDDQIISALSNTPGEAILSILDNHPALKKKVLKVMKQYLHPDRETGHAEDFKKILTIEQSLNQQNNEE